MTLVATTQTSIAGSTVGKVRAFRTLTWPGGGDIERIWGVRFDARSSD